MYNVSVLKSTNEVLKQLFNKPYPEIEKDTGISRQTVSKYFRRKGHTRVDTANTIFAGAIKLIRLKVKTLEFLDEDLKEQIQEIFDKTSNDLKEV